MSILNDPNEAKALGITNSNIPTTPEERANISKRASNILANNNARSKPTQSQKNATRRRRLVGSLPPSEVTTSQKRMKDLKKDYDAIYTELESLLSSESNIQNIDKTYYKLQGIKSKLNDEIKLVPAVLRSDASVIKSAINQNSTSIQSRIKKIKDNIVNRSSANVPDSMPALPPLAPAIPKRSLANATRRGKGIRLSPIKPPTLPPLSMNPNRASIPILQQSEPESVSTPVSTGMESLTIPKNNTPITITNTVTNTVTNAVTNANTKVVNKVNNSIIKNIEYYAEKKEPHTIYRVKYNSDGSIHGLDLINYEGKWTEAVGMPHATFTAQKDLLMKIDCPTQAGGAKQKRRRTRKIQTRRR